MSVTHPLSVVYPECKTNSEVTGPAYLPSYVCVDSLVEDLQSSKDASSSLILFFIQNDDNVIGLFD